MTTFRNVAEAVAYRASRRKGPQMARPSIGRPSRGTWRSQWDAPLIGACMGRAGILPGSEAEREIEAWATGNGPKPTALERALRVEMDAAGILERTSAFERTPLIRITWQDPDTGEKASTLSSEPTPAELAELGLA